jgi:nitroreductase
MDKPAPADHPIAAPIRERWSPRAFGPRPLSLSEWRSLFEAARWAPSCYNDQPWHFLVATREEPAEFAKMLECLVPQNRAWAQHAAALALVVARLRFRHKDSPNRHALYDTGQAVALLSVQATALGIRVHQMAGFSAEKAREVYEIPEGYEAVTAIAFGDPGDLADLPEQLRATEIAERVRRAQVEFVFQGRWGEVFASGDAGGAEASAGP